MTLVEAFRIVGSVTGADSREDARRSAAATILLETLQRLAPRVPSARGCEDDAVQQVIFNLIRRGPRGSRAGDPETDQAVAAYLARSLANAATDMRRRQPGPVLPAEDHDEPGRHDLADDRPDPERQLIDDEEEALCCWAVAEVEDRLIPEVATALRSDAREAFVTSVKELRDVAAGSIGVDGLLARRGLQVTTQSRDALYQQHSRARRRLGKGIERILQSGRYASHKSEAIRRAIGRLRRSE